MTSNLPDNALADELERAAKGSTPAPWTFEPDREGSSMGWIDNSNGTSLFDVNGDSAEQAINAELVVKLVNSLPAIISALRRSPPAGEAVEHARCSTCGATDPRDPDKWYCSNGFHAPSPVEAGILALLRFHRSQVHYTHQSRNEVASLDAAIEALTRLGVGVDGGWQPIETAPKDGSTILIYSTDGDEYIIDTAVWNNGIWASACNPMNALVTHWRPLPSPPSPSPEPAPTDSRGEG